MLISNLTLIIFYFIFLLQQINCSFQCIKTIVVNKCTISVDLCPQYQQQYFKQCTQTYCQNGQSSCLQPKIVLLNQSQCLPLCCDSVFNNQNNNETKSQKFGIFTKQQLQRCQQIQKQRNQINVGGFIIVLIFIVITALFSWLFQEKCKKPFDNLLIYLGRRLKCKYCLKFFSKNHSKLSSQSQYNVYNDQPNDQHIDSKQLSLHTVSKNLAMICPLCLSSRTNTVARCGHYFHFQCISQSYYTHNICPVCKSKQVCYLKTYCNHCFINYVQIDMSDFISKQNLINGLNSFKCAECKSKLESSSQLQ